MLSFGCYEAKRLRHPINLRDTNTTVYLDIIGLHQYQVSEGLARRAEVLKLDLRCLHRRIVNYIHLIKPVRMV